MKKLVSLTLAMTMCVSLEQGCFHNGDSCQCGFCRLHSYSR